jgi:uncharacterized protein
MKHGERTNHLEGQSSPYLLQHLYNPVDWYPWSGEALEKARNENKPILVSIGYSACHWCHVMERESFENQEVAKIMNDNFVCIKVDREERPDVDHLYMNAVQLISGQGGWPLNCFTLPDGRPFWGGTYFPRDQWKNILIRIAELFRNQYQDLENQAQELTEGIASSSFLPVADDAEPSFPADVTHAMAQAILSRIDKKEGGTMGAPKFPLPVIYEFLLHYYHQNPENSEILDAITTTLIKMAMGGIYDQVGGGFSRYSVDENWKVPHFEKMLYDNAQLISLFSKAWMATPQPIFKQVVEETITFISRELTGPQGTFYAALDADSEGEEGKFYVWTSQEFNEVLGNDAPLAREFFNIDGKGLWEKGNNILLLEGTIEEFAASKEMDPDKLIQMVLGWKQKLLAEREKRTRPGLDNKVIVSWNGLMIGALIQAAATFKREEWLNMAEKAADIIIENAVGENGKLYHALTGNVPAIDGFLEDYATMISALIALGQVSGKEDYYHTAAKLLEHAIEQFSSDGTNMFSFSSSDGEQLAAPHFEFQDNVIPASNSIMARNLFYLGNIFENHAWVERSSKMLKDVENHLIKYGNWASNWGILWLHHQNRFFTLSVCGPQANEKSRELLSNYLPDALICSLSKQETQLPVLQNRWSNEETYIYACTLQSCLPPETDTEKVLELFLSKT